MSAPTEPGLYAGVPEDVYHGDRNSISSTQIRRWLEVTPHRWRYEREHPRQPSDEMIWGSAVHTIVLGVGAQPVNTGYDKWQSNAAKAEVARIRAEGGIPMKPKDFDRAHAAAAKVLAHPDAAAVLASGVPELSAYARDKPTGVMMRARFDWLQWLDPRTALVGDLKTTSKQGPDEWIWSAADFGYHQQWPWYVDVLALLGIDVPTWLWLVVCSDPPHEVWVVELPQPAADLGRRRNRRALDGYAECQLTDTWPSHPGGIHHIDLPERIYRQEEYAR
ncbi:PD-(D/E)XK nuclease-like domain-containing protein [Nocardia sp. NPDC050793]|uniref:PD-(D/E)XK nuclease-like domain-containing protein n=1 Tax=Nocardia sp. NPDC050793 TaxID=3155159 RepID=UPI0033D53C08